MATAAAVADYNSASSADSAATQAVNAQSETQAANVTMDAVSSGYGDDVVTAADDAGVYADNTYGVNNTASLPDMAMMSSLLLMMQGYMLTIRMV